MEWKIIIKVGTPHAYLESCFWMEGRLSVPTPKYYAYLAFFANFLNC